MTNKFYEARESLPLELREKFTNEVWKHKPANWVENPDWLDGAYEKYLRDEEQIIIFLENTLVGGKNGFYKN
jgi:hypothetical protein